MWKRFPEIMSFDNTYNTNRFKLPLFQVTGQTCLKSVYNAAFGLIDNERREGFQFLAEGLRQLIAEHEIQLPDVIITDYDKQMKAALGPGKQTGVRQAGRRRQLSVRRIQSEWEIISEDEAPEPTPKRQRRSSRKVPVASMSSSVATNLDHETECEDCISVRL
jgi:hypothetical protein